MHKEGYYSSGEFAKKANVTVRTIRYYDKQNILKPSLLTEDGVVLYGFRFYEAAADTVV
ncbi:MAG: MerR family DNA-binding transcriptional regulator [Lachnospira pectinoschiza]